MGRQHSTDGRSRPHAPCAAAAVEQTARIKLLDIFIHLLLFMETYFFPLTFAFYVGFFHIGVDGSGLESFSSSLSDDIKQQKKQQQQDTTRVDGRSRTSSVAVAAAANDAALFFPYFIHVAECVVYICVCAYSSCACMW